MIFNFNHSEEMNEIKENLKKIENVRNTLADHTDKYRTLCKEINTDFSVLKEIINVKSEYSLLIDCYTFSERLLKSVIYECLNYDRNSNGHLNLFLSKKINPKRFSPNVKYKDFEKELKSLNNEASFLLTANHSSIKIYNEMVESRHRYAHANEYPFPYDNYEDVINVLEYLVFECEVFLKNDEKYKGLIKEYNNIIDYTKKLKKEKDKIIIRNLRDNKKEIIRRFRDDVRKFLNKYEKEFSSINIFNSLIQNLNKISKLNMNKNNSQELSSICLDIGREYH